MLLVKPFPITIFATVPPSKSDDGRTHFVAEASDLMDDQGRERHLEQLHSGSEDVGLAIRFDSGEIVSYYLFNTNHNTDRPEEIDDWEYRPTKESVQKVPGCRGTCVIILND